MSQDRRRVGKLLADAGLISADQLNTAMDYQKSLGGSVTHIVTKLGFISEHDLTKFLSEKYGIQTVDIASMILPIDLVKKIPLELLKKHQIIPVHQSGMTLTIATADPTDFGAIEELQYATGMRIEQNLAKRADILKAVSEFEDAVSGKETGKLKPPTQRAGAAANEEAMLEELRSRSEGKLTPANLSKGDLREALIPALLKKGVITRQELYDAVLDLLLKKGVIDARDFKAMNK